MVTTSGNSDIVVVDLGPNEKMIVGSTIGSGTYAETKMGYSNLGPSTVSKVKKPNHAKKPKPINSASPIIPKQNKSQTSHFGVFIGDGLESKENGGASPQSSKGTWRRLTKESTTTVDMDGVSMEERPKRKLLSLLSEMYPNMVKEKRVKTDIDEISLGKVFKIFLGSAAQPCWGQ